MIWNVTGYDLVLTKILWIGPIEESKDPQGIIIWWHFKVSFPGDLKVFGCKNHDEAIRVRSGLRTALDQMYSKPDGGKRYESDL